jgi:iron(III) transport system ATP-binding protein
VLPITLRKLRREFGGVVAVNDVDLRIPAGALFFMLGPSGCGKTTILRMIAGFQEPSGGQVLFGDRDVTRLPAEKRNAGMVFQSYALWPHMSVFENVAFGLQVRKVERGEMRRRVMEALEMVRMQAYAERRPNQLSGGQQQRVSLARAIAFRPEVLLLDEPLSNLDAKLRLEMRGEIRRICDEIRMTAVYVTHDQKEALSLADGMVVLRDGRVEQQGGPRDLYHRPCSRFVAEFMGETNFLEGKVAAADAEGCAVETAAGLLLSGTTGLAVGTRVWLSVRPESLRIVGGGGMLHGRCEHSVYLGETAQHQVRTPAGLVKVFELDPRTTSRSGQELHLQADRDAVTALTV